MSSVTLSAQEQAIESGKNVIHGTVTDRVVRLYDRPVTRRRFSRGDYFKFLRGHRLNRVMNPFSSRSCFFHHIRLLYRQCPVRQESS